MSGPNPTLINRTATNTATMLPELLAVIGQHLTHPDFASCRQVCHTWNNALTPWFWNAIDDRMACWDRIIRDDITQQDGNTEQWLRNTLATHGHHIRHLNVCWVTILNIAAFTKECRYLLSLTADTIYDRSTFVRTPSPSSSPTQQPQLPEPAETVHRGLSSQFALCATPIPLLAPIFEGALRPPPLIGRARHLLWFQRDANIAQCYWLLILQNPGLVRLALPCMRFSANLMTDDFIYQTLSGLTKLKDLNLNRANLDAPTVLRALPSLERLRTRTWSNLSSLDQDFAGLRSLFVDSFVYFGELLKALDRLPGLMYVRVVGLMSKSMFVGDGSEVALMAAQKKARPFSSVKVFEICELPGGNNVLVALLIELFPMLVDFRCSKAAQRCREAVEALWEHCYYLDAIDGEYEMAAGWRVRRAEDVQKA